MVRFIMCAQLVGDMIMSAAADALMTQRKVLDLHVHCHL